MTARFDKVSWTAHEPFDTAYLILVEVHTDSGLVGIGEIATGPQSTVCAMLEMMAPVIKGMDPLAPNEIWQRLFSITVPRPGGIGPWDGLPTPLPRNKRPQFMAAMAGIDIALWDIRGKAANLPVFRLLGGTRTEVFTYAVGGFYVEGEIALRLRRRTRLVRRQGLPGGEAEDRRAVAGRRGEARAPGARGHRAGRALDARPERAGRCRGLHPLLPCGRAL